MRQPGRVEPCRVRCPCLALTDHRLWQPSLWTDSGPEGRQSLASALFTKLEVEGYQKIGYELTPDAVDLDLGAALPAQLETDGQMGGFGRGGSVRVQDIGDR